MASEATLKAVMKTSNLTREQAQRAFDLADKERTNLADAISRVSSGSLPSQQQTRDQASELPSGGRSSLVEFSRAAQEAVDLARQKRNKLGLDMVEGQFKPGTLSASNFGSILGSLNRASTSFTEGMVDQLETALEQDEEREKEIETFIQTAILGGAPQDIIDKMRASGSATEALQIGKEFLTETPDVRSDVVTAGGRKLLIDLNTGDVIRDLGTAPSSGRNTGSEDDVNFTDTQLMKGARNAGVSLETFVTWDKDTQNKFVNPTKDTDPTSLSASGLTVAELVSAFSGMSTEEARGIIQSGEIFDEDSGLTVILTPQEQSKALELLERMPSKKKDLPWWKNPVGAIGL